MDLKVRSLTPAAYEQSAMDASERDWLGVLARLKLGGPAWVRPSFEELERYARQLGLDVDRILR